MVTTWFHPRSVCSGQLVLVLITYEKNQKRSSRSLYSFFVVFHFATDVGMYGVKHRATGCGSVLRRSHTTDVFAGFVRLSVRFRQATAAVVPTPAYEKHLSVNANRRFMLRGSTGQRSRMSWENKNPNLHFLGNKLITSNGVGGDARW